MILKQFYLTFCYVVCCFIVKYNEGARILGIFPVAATSHFGVFQGMLLDLANKGHQVDVISNFPLKNPRANYTDIVNLNEKVSIMANQLSIEFILKTGRDYVEEHGARHIGNELCHAIGNSDIKSLIDNPPNDPPYDLLITELFFSNCYFAFGRYLKIPIVAMTSGPMLSYSNEPLGNPLNPAYVPAYRCGSIYHMNFWERLKNTLSTWNTVHRLQRLTGEQDEIIKKHFGPEMPGVRELEKDLSLLLVNSHYSLNGVRPFTPAVVEVGGLHLRDEKLPLPGELKKWLDDTGENGFIYISFGSLIKFESLPGKIFAELYSAFNKLKPISVLIKATNPEEMPPGIPENVITMKWVPQLQVLRHKNIRGFVTHGGLGGVQEAIVSAVPFVGIPFFADQPRNVKNCVDKGVAVFLDLTDITTESFVESVKSIVYDPKYKKNMISLSKQFLDRPLNPRWAAVYWVEYILKHGGDSLRSPAVKLTWWQLALLDVYGFIIITILVTIYLVKIIISFIIRRFFNTKLSNERMKLKKKN